MKYQQDIHSLEELNELATGSQNCRYLVIALARKMGASDGDYELCYDVLLAAAENGDEEMIIEDVNFYKNLLAFSIWDDES